MASTRSFNQRSRAFNNNERGLFGNGSTYPSGPWVPSIPGVPNSIYLHTEVQGRSMISGERQFDSSTSERTVIAVTQDKIDYIKVDITNYLGDAQSVRREIASKVSNNAHRRLNIYRIYSEKFNTSVPMEDDELLITCLGGDNRGTLKFFVKSSSGAELPGIPTHVQAPLSSSVSSTTLPTNASIPERPLQRVVTTGISLAGGSTSVPYADIDLTVRHVNPDRSRLNYKVPITNPSGNTAMAESRHSSSSQQSSEPDTSGFSVPYYDDSPITVANPSTMTPMASSLPGPSTPPAGRANIARNMFSEPRTLTKTERLQKYRKYLPDTTDTELLPRQSSERGPAPGRARVGTISRRMTMDEVLSQLYLHGCRNITPDLNVSMSSRIPVASGGFGDVYRGRLNDGMEVGLKCVRIDVGFDDEGPKKVRDAAKELYIWSKCDHPNVLKLIGVTQHRNQIAMVSPWMKYGDLPHYLQAHPRVNRYHLCAQIADGVAYLHRENMVHGDLKGVNILVSEDHTPKITDFGTASRNECTLNFTQTSRSDSMSIRWSAPEILNEGTEKNSPAADVFSLGMTILEVITGKVPFPDTNQIGSVVMKLGLGEHPKRPEAHIPSGNERADRLWSLLTDCWAMDPKRRPTAIEVRDQMRMIASM